MGAEGGGGDSSGADAGAMGALATFNPYIAAAMSVMNMLGGAKAKKKARGDILGMADFNPFSGFIQGAGGFGPNGFMADPSLMMGQGMIGGMLPFLGAGGFGDQFMNMPQLHGATDSMSQSMNQQVNPFWNEANFANNMANISGMGDFFANRVHQGPQDLTGGMQNNLFNFGFDTLQNAGDVDGLISDNLAASRAMAAPFEQLLQTRFADSEFLNTMGATTGSNNRMFDFTNSQMLADQNRILGAQQMGLQEQGLLSSIGMQALGAGSGILGHNINAFGQDIGAANMFANLGLQGENQGFLQNMQAIGANQNAQNMLFNNLFGINQFGGQLQQQALSMMPSFFGGMIDFGNMGIQGMQGFLNAEANRIGSTGMHAQSLASMANDGFF